MLGQRRSTIVALAVLAVSFGRAQATGLGLVAGAQAAEVLYAKIDEWNNELRAEANSDANRAKLFDRLKAAREALMPIKDNTTTGLAQLDERLKQLRAQNEGDPAGWTAEARSELERTADAREKLAGVEAGLTGAWDNLKWLQGRQNVPGFDPFVNPTFKERFAQLGTQVQEAATAFDAFNETYNIETVDRADAGSAVVVVPAAHVRIRNTSEEMRFIVNGVTLEPGATEAVPIRLGDHRGLTIRAVAFDAKRKQLHELPGRLAEANQARLFEVDADALYKIRYGTDTLSTRMEATRETYAWEFGANVTRAVGQRSPWAPGGPVIAEPEVTSSAGNRDADAVTWWLPAVEDAEVTFSFTVRGTVHWETERARDHMSLGVVESDEVSSGTLEVIVSTR